MELVEEPWDEELSGHPRPSMVSAIGQRRISNIDVRRGIQAPLLRNGLEDQTPLLELSVLLLIPLFASPNEELLKVLLFPLESSTDRLTGIVNNLNTRSNTRYLQRMGGRMHFT